MGRKRGRRWLGAVLLLLWGCKGPQGPTGPQGDPGTGIDTVSVLFQQGVSPTSGYNATIASWADAQDPENFHGTTNAFLRVKSGPASQWGRALVRFGNLKDWIPANAKVAAAFLTLTTQTTTNLGSGTYTIGAHNGITPEILNGPPLIGACLWTVNVMWNRYDGIGLWSTCGGGEQFRRGTHFAQDPMDTVALTSAINGQKVKYGWSLSPSMVTGWITGPNHGVILLSEGEGTDAPGFVDFYDETAATLTDRPALWVSYYIP